MLNCTKFLKEKKNRIKTFIKKSKFLNKGFKTRIEIYFSDSGER